VTVKLLISIFYSLSKVFRYSFLVTTRKVEIPESYLLRDRDRARARARARRQTMRLITS
jgi:hypothetical protein